MGELQQEMVEKAKTSKPPVIRMDKSRDFSTVHGDRPPGDRHAKVFYYQDGLPFSATGILLHDHPDVTEDKEKVALVMRLMERAIKRGTSAPGDDEDDDEADLDSDRSGPVNLEMWARGEEKYEWQEVTNAIARRFSKRVGNKRDALELLVAEKVVTVGALSKEHKRTVQD